MEKLKNTALIQGEQPSDFYSWGDVINTGIISKKEQFDEKLGEAFDSIEIKEDKETPETDYVLKVLGKEAGRVIIPFDMVVKDAYYDPETKEVVIIVMVAESQEKEIRFSVADLIDVYTGDGVTINVEKNVISITKEVMDKFDDLRRSIDYEKQYRKDGDDKLNAALKEETSAREEADTKLDNDIKAEASAREVSDANLLQLINNVETNLEGSVANLAANDASLEAQIRAEKEAREKADVVLDDAVKNETKEREEADSELSEKIKDEADARDAAIAKEISDRKDADADLAKDYNDKIDKVQDNLQELTRAHIDSVTELQKADASLHDEILGVYKECISEPIPLDKIRELFA